LKGSNLRAVLSTGCDRSGGRLGRRGKMLRTVIAIALAAAAPICAAADIDPLCVRVLAPDEAESLAGVRPLTLVGSSQVRFATGTCNYATKVEGARTLVFLVSVSKGSTERDFQALRRIAIKPRDASGIGDEAFTAEGVVGFRKGRTVVSLGSFVDQKTGRHRVQQTKLLELAKVLAARI
jgi:hypothetical protein